MDRSQKDNQENEILQQEGDLVKDAADGNGRFSEAKLMENIQDGPGEK